RREIDTWLSRRRARASCSSASTTSARRPHFDRLAFRTPRRIFATLAGHGRDVNFMFDPLAQETFCEMAPSALAPVPGGWGRMGATRCDLAAVDEATFLAAAEAAHARASQPRPRGRAKR